MQPLYGKYRGFKGFRASLGLEEVVIDFSKLPSGLIALVGENGMGKTTLLDNMHPYRIMPYKLRDKSEWTTGSFNYYDQCYGRDALKEFIWADPEGKRFRSVIQIDAERRKQEAYLYVQAEDGAWIPYNDAVKDGKTGEYDQAVEELLGSPTLFFSSNFRSQDARKLSSYPRSEILGIVCELLNIDKIKEQGEKATKVASALSSMVNDLETKKNAIRELFSSRDDLVARREHIISDISTCETDIALIKECLHKTEQEINDLNLSNAAQTLTQKRVEELKKRSESLLTDIERLEASITSGAAEYESELKRITESIDQAVLDLKRDTKTLAVEEQQEREIESADLAAIHNKKRAIEDLLSRGEAIKEAASRVTVLESEMASDRTQLEALRSTHVALETNIATLNYTATSIDNNIIQESRAHKEDSDALAAEEARETDATRIDILDVASKKLRVESTLAKAADIRQAVAREQELTGLLLTERPTLEAMRSEGAELREQIAKYASIDNEMLSAQARLDDLRRLTVGLEKLDCYGDGSKTVNKACTLLESAIKAEQQIPTVEKEIAGLQAKMNASGGLVEKLKTLTSKGTALAAKVAAAESELNEVRKVAQMASDLTNAEVRLRELVSLENELYTRLQQRISDIDSRRQTSISRYQAKHTQLDIQKQETATRLADAHAQHARSSESCDFFTAQIAETETELAETRLVANLAAELSSATARIAELEESESSLKSRTQQRISDISKKVGDITTRSEEYQRTLACQKMDLSRKWSVAKGELDQSHAALIKEVSGITEETRKLESTLNGDADKEIADLKTSVINHRNNADAEETRLKNLHSELGSIEGQLVDLQKREDDLKQLDAKISQINEEMVNWKVLAKACSNDGIIPLEIGDAGPQISSDTNDLLSACYGPRFSVRLETQAEKASGGLKEVFDITVFDSERDEVKSIRNMCGGEVTYIEDALSRSFGLHNSGKAANRISSVFTDEKDGALDASHKQDFLEIKLKAMEMGSHTREFFISHTPELYDKAAARIVFEPGKVSVQCA